MIPSRELRIGNCVLVGQTMQCITMIDDGSSSFAATPFDPNTNKTETTVQHRLESLEPVPLTDAVLRQCRFVYHDYFKFWQLVAGQKETRSEMNIDADYNIIDFMRKPVVKKLASLHQLQNIYFLLKGKELGIQAEA
jgi:hypothetical protein